MAEIEHTAASMSSELSDGKFFSFTANRICSKLLMGVAYHLARLDKFREK